MGHRTIHTRACLDVYGLRLPPAAGVALPASSGLPGYRVTFVGYTPYSTLLLHHSTWRDFTVLPTQAFYAGLPSLPSCTVQLDLCILHG